MAYGVLSTPLHRRLPLEWAYVAFVLFSLLLFLLVKLKERVRPFVSFSSFVPFVGQKAIR
jgi:hypothetical protein